jgi:hypothetical protein
MYSLHAQPAFRLMFTSETAAGHIPPFRRLWTLFGVLGRRLRTNADAIPHYEGRAWCDSTEQQVITDIATCRRAI